MRHAAPLVLAALAVMAPGCASSSKALARAQVPLFQGGFGAFIGDGGAGRVDPLQRKVARSAEIDLGVTDFDDCGRQVARLAEERGGFVLASGLRSYQLRVPAERFDEALDALSKLGEVTDRRIFGDDVTAEYFDVETRLRNAEKARDGYLKLLDQAKAVEEILKVEQALNEVQERIESLKGRQQLLDRRLQLAAITVSLAERRRPGPVTLVGQGIWWVVSKLFYW